jgi:hypothetical protein
LNSFLILPIQRLPRYKLLIDDILNNTSEEENIHPSLKKLSVLITKIAHYCNGQQKIIQNNDRLKKISKELSMNDLINPSTRLLSESDENSVFINEKYSATVYLLNDCLIIKKNKMINKIKKFDFGLNMKNWVIDLNNFVIQFVFLKKNYFLKFENQKNFQSFVNELN